MSNVIPIKYYKLLNFEVNGIIYPQIRSSINPENILWHGRDCPKLQHMVAYGGETIVDLATVFGADNQTPFFLSCQIATSNIDKYYKSQSFVYDPESAITATAVYSRTTDGSHFDYCGTKLLTESSITGVTSDQDLEAQSDFKTVLINEVLRVHPINIGTANLPWYLGKFSVAQAAALVGAGAAVGGYLTSNGYTTTIEYDRINKIVRIRFSRSSLHSPNMSATKDVDVMDVPPAVRKDWENAIASAQRQYPDIEDKGVEEER